MENEIEGDIVHAKTNERVSSSVFPLKDITERRISVLNIHFLLEKEIFIFLRKRFVFKQFGIF